MNNIVTMKLWEGKSMLINTNVESPVIDLRYITPLFLFSLNWQFAGAGSLKFEYFTSPTKDGVFTEGAADIIASVAGGGARVASASRQIASEVATIITGAAHNLIANEYALVTGMKNIDYNGIHKVASAPDGTTFTFAVPGLADEDDGEAIPGPIADTGGLIGDLKVGRAAFTPIAAMPFLKIKMTELNAGAIDYADVWLNVA